MARANRDHTVVNEGIKQPPSVSFFDKALKSKSNFAGQYGLGPRGYLVKQSRSLNDPLIPSGEDVTAVKDTPPPVGKTPLNKSKLAKGARVIKNVITSINKKKKKIGLGGKKKSPAKKRNFKKIKKGTTNRPLVIPMLPR